MVVTEFALLPLRDSAQLAPDADLTALLKESVAVQEDWILARNAALPGDGVPRATYMYQQLEDPSVALILMQWASPAAHHEWIASPENQALMGRIAAYMDVEQGSGRSVTLFHLDSDVFVADESQSPNKATNTSLTEPVLSCELFDVKGENKARFQLKLEGGGAVTALEEASKPHAVRGGWRIEHEDTDEGKEHFIAFAGWGSVEEHRAAASKEAWEGLRSLAEKGTDVRHYRRII